MDSALRAYRADLTARQSNPYNADWPRVHLTSVLLAKPVALLTATELKRWRDGRLGTMAASTVNRLGRCLCAALELASQHDERIQNRRAWETGLADLPNVQQARNVVLSDAKVREFVASAYGLDRQFGLLADVWPYRSTTEPGGAAARRGFAGPSDATEDHAAQVGQGRWQNRAQKKSERYSVPITPALSAKLKAATLDRADDMPLLLQSDGRPWGDNPGQNYHRLVAAAVVAIGADPDATMYSLRHSSIVRALLRNVPIRLIAATHNTSTRMIEANYSKFITEHAADDVSRIGLLQDEPPTGENIVALAS